MIDHIGFPVSDYARVEGVLLKALAPLDYHLVMEVTRNRPGTIPRQGSAPMESLISGSAAKADWTSRCMSRFWRRIAPPLTPSTQPPWPPGDATMALPGIRAHYHRKLLRAFVLDPDGHNIEAVCHAPA